MKSGQALIFVFLLLTIVGILVFALTGMWQSEIRVNLLDKDGLEAFYLAQAGLERGKIWARHNPDSTLWTSSPYDSGWITLGGGRYRFSVEDLGGVDRRVTARGQKLDGVGNVSAEKYIRVEITNIENPFTDPSDDDEVDWTWREF